MVQIFDCLPAGLSSPAITEKPLTSPKSSYYDDDGIYIAIIGGVSAVIIVLLLGVIAFLYKTIKEKEKGETNVHPFADRQIAEHGEDVSLLNQGNFTHVAVIWLQCNN